MTSLAFETEAMRPTRAWCTGEEAHATLADGREIRAPLWWYPFLLKASPEERADIELEFSGLWWPAVDEGISIKGMLLGWKAPGAVPPSVAAE